MIRSQTINVAGRSGSLQGTFTQPSAGTSNIVILIPGSGPTDRDGNSPYGLRARAYRLLAEDLAQADIASLRIDKRGMFGSIAAAENANAVRVDDYVDDVVTWIDAARRLDVGQIFLAGHSEGGLIALVCAAKRRIDIAGLVLIATPGRRLNAILMEQLEATLTTRPLIDAARHAISRLSNGDEVDTSSLPPVLASLFTAEVQPFLIDLMSLDPAVLISTVEKPTLIIQGKRDLQIGRGDAELLYNHCAQASLVLLPEVNHVLKQVVNNDRAANLATYSDPMLPLAPGVVKNISAFIQSTAER